MRLLPAIFLAGAVLGPAAQTAKSITPCSLVTKAEVTEAIGASVTDGAPNANNKAVCDFISPETGGAANVTLTPKAPGDSAEKMVAELKKRKIDSEVVAGFGDSAYVAAQAYGTQQIGVYKGANHVIVTVLLMGKPEAKAKQAAQAIMRKALTRMP